MGRVAYTRRMDPKISSIAQWVYALFSAFIGGASTCITNMFIAPESFNISTSEGTNKIITAALVQGAVSVALYLKQSPLPFYDFEGGTNQSPKTTINSVTTVTTEAQPDNSGHSVTKLPLILLFAAIPCLLLSGCTINPQSARAIATSAVSIAAFEASQKLTPAQTAEYKEFLTNVALAAVSLKGEENVTVSALVKTITVFNADLLAGPNAKRYKFYLAQIETITGGYIQKPEEWDAWLTAIADSADRVNLAL